MHRIATIPGGWTPNTAGVILLNQTPAPLVFLSAADTDLQTVAGAIAQLPDDFPEIRAANLLQLQQSFSIDHYAETVLSQAQVIVVRLLGGRSYWSYGLEVVQNLANQHQIQLVILPGDDRPDVGLMGLSTLSLVQLNRCWQYFVEGGIDNYVNGLQYIDQVCDLSNHAEAIGTIPSPQTVPRIGRYDWRSPQESAQVKSSYMGKVGILFYRAHYLSGNLQVIDALCEACHSQQMEPVPIFLASLRDHSLQAELSAYFTGSNPIEILLNTTSFAVTTLTSGIEFGADEESAEFWRSLNVPVLQVIFSSSAVEQWQESSQGLTPRDVAINVALPEVDGRIITRAVSCKSVAVWQPDLETDVTVYQPLPDRVAFVVQLAANWLRLKHTPIAHRKVALLLANYPNRDGRLANGVGLDTPASCVGLLKALQAAGYQVENLPGDAEELMNRLTAGVTNDPESQGWRPVFQQLDLQDYHRHFGNLPEQVQRAMGDRWGFTSDYPKANPTEKNIPIAGLQLGNIFVGIQPSRGYDQDPSLNYHAPDLEPAHEYLAFYHWLREKFGAQAVIHVGKHGNLEWLPGKSVALSEQCYPEIALGPLPHFYPFIVNDPGEGAQAKRRAQAVIVDHLTPPLTRAELYGDLEKLEALIDEYYEAQSLDPTRLKPISDRLLALLYQSHLAADFGIDTPSRESLSEFLTLADGHLCDLKEAQIRDGLHILGQCPQGTELIALIQAIARAPGWQRLGLTQAIAQDWGLRCDPLTIDLGEIFDSEKAEIKLDKPLAQCLENCRTYGDLVARLEETAQGVIASRLALAQPRSTIGPASDRVLRWIQDTLCPALQQTPQEITELLRGLNGEYLPSGPAGAPTRGRPDVLPTGRNFYSVDIRAIPTPTAWDVGRKAAEALIESYTQDNGDYPQAIALSIWGTSTMRTGGDDVAQVLALLGVQPIWDGPSRRVVDFEILPLSVLGRPRVDVTVRISGFFRDSFPNLIDLMHQAIAAVGQLEEPSEDNPLADQVRQEQLWWQQQGLQPDQAQVRSQYRIFGSKPGAYGAGLQGLIEAQNWQDDQDLARAYINWSSYVYDGTGQGRSLPDVFKQRLQQLQVVLHNQDNREHDLLDSDDYYQFQGGLTAAVRATTGKNPQTYFGDNAVVANPKVRRLSEEMARVYRSRVVNPKWIAGVMRHGYKGAFEMAATVDYLFAYDATAHCVADHMYQGVAEAYVLDPSVQAFVQRYNPWALRDMAERLMEANQRGLWTDAAPEILADLRSLVLESERAIEMRHVT